MAILVVSDSHGKVERILKAIEENKGKIDRVCFTGDGLEDIKLAEEEYSDIAFDYVAGNCDGFYAKPLEKVIIYNNKKILLTHGHLYEGISAKKRLIERCKEEDINLVFSGHTHEKREEYIDNILFLNPGSIGRPRDGSPTYSIVEINDTIKNTICYI